MILSQNHRSTRSVLDDPHLASLHIEPVTVDPDLPGSEFDIPRTANPSRCYSTCPAHRHSRGVS